MDSRNDHGVGVTASPHTEVPRERLLRRPIDDRVLFGVAAGVARYLDVDPVVVRIAFVLLTVFGGSGLVLYLIGVIAIPEDDRELPARAGGVGSIRPGGHTAATAVGVVLIAVGSLSLVSQLLPGLRDLTGPAVLLASGALVLLWGARR